VTKITIILSLLRKSALPSILAGLGVISAVTSTSVSAAKFGVKIVNESGQAIEGAAVCIGMPGNYTQFGSLLTDESGLAMLEVPQVPFVLTVSKAQVGGFKKFEPARGFNLIKQLTLKEGTSGPKCTVVGSMKSQSSVRITNVQVTDDTYTRTLKPHVVGKPTEYRVSRKSSFEGAKWKRFDSSIPLSANLSEKGEVYIQMRRYAGLNKSWIEALSDVVNVKLPTFE
jgi:ribosomal protein L11